MSGTGFPRSQRPEWVTTLASSGNLVRKWGTKHVQKIITAVSDWKHILIRSSQSHPTVSEESNIQ